MSDAKNQSTDQHETLAELARRMADRVANIHDDVRSSFESNDPAKRHLRLLRVVNEMQFELAPIVIWLELRQPQAAELLKRRLCEICDEAEACVAQEIPEYEGGKRPEPPVEKSSEGAKRVLAMIVTSRITADSIRAIAGDIEVEQKQQQAPDVAQNIFRKDNDTWTIRFNGSEIQKGIKDCKALGDIAYLLRNQGKHIDIRDLPNNRPDPLKKQKKQIELSDHQEHATPTQSTPMATKEDGKLILTQITKLQEERSDETDVLVSKENEVKIEFLRNQYSQNFDKYGEPRELTGDIQKMIESTQKRVIERFITKKLAGLLPKLATHLIKHLEIDKMCFYTPESEIIWDFGAEK